MGNDYGNNNNKPMEDTKMTTNIKLNLDDILAQVKPIEKKERAKKDAAAKAATVSTRTSLLINGTQFPSIVALHEYVFGKKGTILAEADGAGKLEALALKLMDTFYPAIANPDTKTAKKWPMVRASATGEVIKAGLANEPIQRGYNSKHYASYLNRTLGKGDFSYAEEVGLSEEEMKAAEDAYAKFREGADETATA